MSHWPHLWRTSRHSRLGHRRWEDRFKNSSRTRPGQMSSRPITLPFTPTHPHMHIHIPYSYDIDLIAHTRKAMSQHTITKVCFQFLPFSPFSVNLNVHDVTGSAHYTRPVQFPSNWTLITGCFPSTILLFPSAFYFIKSPSTLLTKAIAFLSLGSDKIPSVSYGTDN